MQSDMRSASITCVKCGQLVEIERENHALPVCFSCAPPAALRDSLYVTDSELSHVVRMLNTVLASSPDAHTLFDTRVEVGDILDSHESIHPKEIYGVRTLSAIDVINGIFRPGLDGRERIVAHADSSGKTFRFTVSKDEDE